MVTQFKMRAECRADVARMMKVVPFRNMAIKSIMAKKTMLPDVEVTFSSELSLMQVWTLLQKIPDGHVMAETIDLKACYTGNRRHR